MKSSCFSGKVEEGLIFWSTTVCRGDLYGGHAPASARPGTLTRVYSSPAARGVRSLGALGNIDWGGGPFRSSRPRARPPTAPGPGRPATSERRTSSSVEPGCGPRPVALLRVSPPPQVRAGRADEDPPRKDGEGRRRGRTYLETARTRTRPSAAAAARTERGRKTGGG